MIYIILTLTLIIDFLISRPIERCLSKDEPQRRLGDKVLGTFFIMGVLLIPCYFLSILIIAIFAVG